MPALKSFLTLLGCLVLLCVFTPFCSRAEEPLVVHEWGVLIRQNPVALPFDNLVEANKAPVTPFNTLGAPAELFADLPGFALIHDKQYQAKIEERPRVWRKPILHFYGPDNLQVKVTI